MQQKMRKKMYEIKRRAFMKMTGAIGLALLLTSFFGLGSLSQAYAASEGKNAADRAVNAAKQLKTKMKGDTLTVMVPSGGEGSFIASKPWWEEATGIKLNIVVVPIDQIREKAMNIAITKSSAFDVLSPSPFSVPDLAEAGLAADLTNWAKKYDPDVGGKKYGVIPPIFLYGAYKEKLYGMCIDGDVNSLQLRRDWLEDPDNQKSFEDKYGYSLRKPVLWQELFDQIEFFTDKDIPRYGAWLFHSPFYAKWTYLQLLVSKGVLPFDKEMHPTLTSDESIEALEELIALKPYIHPGASTGGWSEQYKAYAEGNVYATFSWPSFIKYINNPDFSKIPGKLAACKVPGRKLESGMILRPCRFTFSWVLMVSNFSKNRELSYLYCQWLYSPSISYKHLPVEGGYFDPYRYSHMTKELLTKFTPYWQETKEALTFNIENSYPELQMKGGSEYMRVLDENVIAAFEGMKKPEKALKETAEEWEKITDRYGRDKQIEQWTFLKSTFGANLRKAMNLPDPPEWTKELYR